MSTNLNGGKVNNFDLEDDMEEESTSSKGKNKEDFKKFIIKLMLVVGGSVLLLILVLSLSSMVTKKKYTYEQVEEIMADAAKAFIAENSEYSTILESRIIEVPVENLVAAGKMKPLAEYKNENCTGKVIVSKVNNEYIYTPTLNCGTNYSSTALYTKVLEDSPITTTGYGLYSINGEKVFRGELVNNYVKLEKALWRIVKIDQSNNIVLIKETQTGYTSAWDNRYNEDIGYNVGINTYTTSRIKEYLQSIYNTTKETEIFLSTKDKAKLISYDACVGSRATNSKTNTNEIECKTKESSQKIGLLTVSDYINASTDPKCVTAESLSCQNYNYLIKNFNWWLATPVTNTTDRAYSITTKGEIKSSQTGDYYNVRPVIKLNSTVTISGGTGTEKDPYTVK